MEKFLGFIRQNALPLFSLLLAGILFVWLFSNSATWQNQLSARRANVIGFSPNQIPVEVQPDISNYPYLGKADAAVVFVEYGDYQCGYCNRFNQETLPLLKSAFIDSGKVKFVYKDLILFGAESQRLAEATHCAADQGWFWELHDGIFELKANPEIAGQVDIIASLAANYSPDVPEFEQCLESGKYSQLVQDSTQEAISFGIDGTPTSVINGVLLQGALPFTQFAQVINAELNK